MMVLCMWMIYAKRIFFCGNIVSQSQIQLIHITFFTCDRSDRIMRFTIRFCKNECSLICIASPNLQHMSCQINQALLIFMTDTKYRQRPFYNTSLHILIARNSYIFLNFSLCHSKRIMAALEMIVTENRTSHNR